VKPLFADGIAVDHHRQMFDVLQACAEQVGVKNQIRPYHRESDRLGIEDPVDFALAFATVHEVPDAR
jgi:hypothetical protein